jgi:hypothetical protein
MAVAQEQDRFDPKTLPKTLWQLFMLVIRFIPGEFRRYLPRSLTIGGLVFIAHTYILGVINDGYAANGAFYQSSSTAAFIGRWIVNHVSGVTGNVIGNVIFYTVLTALITLIFSGFKNFGGFRRFSGMAFGRFRGIFRIFKEKSDKRLILMLTGLAISAFLSFIWRNALVNLMLVLVLVRALVIMKKGGLFHLLARVIAYDFNRLFRSNTDSPGRFTIEDTSLVFQGVTMGMTITAIPWLESYGLIIGGIAIIIIVLINSSRSKPEIITVLLTMILTGIGLLLSAKGLFADDGGIREAGGTIGGWLQSSGANRAIALGLTAGLGGALGPVLVNILNGVGDSLVGGGPNDPLKDQDWDEYDEDQYDEDQYDEENDEEYDENEYTDDEDEEETIEGEEEQEEFDTWIGISANRSVLKADGQDSLWFFAKFYTNNPEPDTAALAARTQGIDFDFDGPGDSWIQTRAVQMSEGYKVIQVRALAPESADPDENPSVTIIAHEGGEHDSATFTLENAIRVELILSIDGPESIRPDGEHTTKVIGKIKCYPDNPDKEEEIAAGIGFQCESTWIDLRSPIASGDEKSSEVSAYPPGGDFSKDQPEKVTIRAIAHFGDQTLEKSIDLVIDDLDLWIELIIDQDTLPVYKQTETYVHATVMVQAGGQKVVSEELTNTLQLRDPGEEGEWLVPSQVGYANGEAYFTVYAWYPYEEPGIDVPETNLLKVYTDAGEKPLEADVKINIIPFPVPSMVVTKAEEVLRPDVEQLIQLKIGLQLDPPDEEVNTDDFYTSLDIQVEGENGWLVLYEGEKEGDEMVFDIGCENQTDDETAIPPESLPLVIHASLFGQEMTENVTIQMEALPLPEILISLERSENPSNPQDAVFPDGEDFVTVLATLQISEDIEGLNLEELVQDLSFELLGGDSNWAELSEEAFDAAGDESVKYVDVYGILKTEEHRKSMPDSVTVWVKGTLNGREFEKEQNINLIGIPEISIDFQYDREIESPIPEDQLALTGEDWIEIKTWFDLTPKLESIDLIAIQQTMDITHLNDSDKWLTFTEEKLLETADGLYGRSVRVAGIPHPEADVGDIPSTVEIRVECKYLGEEYSEHIPVRILGKPVLELNKDEVVLGSGDEEQEIVVIGEIDNAIEEGWDFKLDPEPNHASYSISVEDNKCEITFKPKKLADGVEEGQEEEINVLAFKGEFELAKPLKIILSPIGLFIHSEMPIVIPIDEKEASLKYSVRTVEDGEAKLNFYAMQDHMDFSNPIESADDDKVKNAFKLAGFTMGHDGFAGEAGGDAEFALHKFSIETILPGPPSEVIEAAIRVSVAGRDEPEFTKEIRVQIALQDMDPINAALEKQRCEEIVEKYIPTAEKMREFYDLIDEKEGLFGAEEYFELRKMIWETASKMLIEEAAAWDNQADWLGRMETFLEYTEWVSGLAVQVLATAALGPYAGAALQAKTFIQAGLVGYAKGDPFSETIYNLVKDMIIAKPGETYLDPEFLSKRIPKPIAWSIYVTYKFFWGIYYEKKTAYESAKGVIVEIAEDQLVSWLTPKVAEWGAKKGLIPNFDDLPKASTKEYTIDELPPAAKDMANRIKNGKADFDDVINCMTDPQVMRSLKNAPEEVRIAFNKTLKEEFYNRHDAEVENMLRSQTGKEWSGKEIEIRDVGTPGKAKGAPDADINTDRDFRAGWTDDNGEFHEIPVSEWKEKSDKEITRITKKDPEDLRQLATDKFHIEASQEYSDQGFEVIDDPNNPGKKILVKKQKGISSYEEFKKGDSVALIDPEGMAKMYQEKYEAELRKGDLPQNKSEAMAQSKKAIKTVNSFKQALSDSGVDTPAIPEKFKKGMDLVEEAAVDHRSDPDGVDTALKSLGIPGGMDGLNNYVCAYLESFKNYVPKRDPFDKI